MTPKRFADYVRLKTKTNTNSLTDTDLLILMGARQDEIAEAILESDEDILLLPQYSDLEDDRRDYKYPTDVLSRIKRCEAKFNGTDWIPLTEIDITEIDTPIATEANIVAYFNNTQVDKYNPGGARFDLMRKALNIYSGTIDDVTAGLRLYCDTYPTAITDLSITNKDLSEDPSTTTHGIPRPMHRLWATGVIIDYKEGRAKPIPLNERETAYEVDRNRAIKTLKHGNLDREISGGLPPASTRGNEGYDY